MNTVFYVILGLVVGWSTTVGVKSQLVRLMDVFILGPLLIWVGWKSETIVDYFLVFIGAATMAYNYKNWLAEENKILV